MIASSWFSIEMKEGTEKAPVHHNNTMCKVGKNIEKYHHRYGTDNRPLCKNAPS
jgi:hypothetical protein